MGKTLEKLKNHAIDSTAMLTESFPIFAAYEVGLAGMSSEMSLNSKIFAGTLTYLGLGSLFSKGRDISKSIFLITDQTKEHVQHIHDTVYTAAFNIAVSPPIYAASQFFAGEDIDLKKITIGTGLSVVVGGLNGGLSGYAIDVYRDLTGVKDCERKAYPNVIKKRSSKFKKSLAIVLTAASIATVGVIYSIADSNKNDFHEKQVIENCEQIPSAKSLESIL